MFLTLFSGAVLPLLAAKQRFTDRKDWMSTDAEVACPDPHCKSKLRIIRTGVRKFNHSEVTAVPLQQDGAYRQSFPCIPRNLDLIDYCTDGM